MEQSFPKNGTLNHVNTCVQNLHLSGSPNPPISTNQNENSLPEIQSPQCCVICLELVLDCATAVPCHHDQFHFSCLATWLHQHAVCPLCKHQVTTVEYSGESGKLLYHVPSSVDGVCPTRTSSHIAGNDLRSLRRFRRRRGYSPPLQDSALVFRRQVYEQSLFSLYVGSNPYSGYRNVSPARFASEPGLVAKARKWIRREFQVFDFLDPNSISFGRADRRATNSEFLLEYTISILCAIDLKGSSGQAESLLVEFLGRQNTRLFLHELESWLRSPFDSLAEWDAAVQYLHA